MIFWQGHKIEMILVPACYNCYFSLFLLKSPSSDSGKKGKRVNAFDFLFWSIKKKDTFCKLK